MNEPQVRQLIQSAVSAALAQQEARFQDTIETLQAEVAALRQTPRPSSRPHLPDLDKFDGTLTMWETWHPLAEAKLRLDAHTIGTTEELKFWYIYSSLDKKIQTLVTPQLRQGANVQCQQLFDQLQRLCEDPNAARKAEDKLLGLKQYADQTYNTFLAVFEKYLYRAGADSWPDVTIIGVMRRQLNDKLKKRLATQITMPTVYRDYVKTLQQLDSGHEGEYRPHAPRNTGGNGGGGEPMQLSRIVQFEAEDDAKVPDDRRTVLFNAETGLYEDAGVYRRGVESEQDSD